MRKALFLRSAVLITTLCSGCVAGRSVAPIILYAGPPMPPDDISVIRVVGKNHPSLQIRTLSRVGTSLEPVYQARTGQSAWAPPDHFGGLQATQQQTPEEDLSAIPDEFHVLPGTYRVEFSYVPVVDRWGWTHKPSGESVTWLECEAGHIYFLEGRMNEGGEGLSLVKIVLLAGEG